MMKMSSIQAAPMPMAAMPRTKAEFFCGYVDHSLLGHDGDTCREDDHPLDQVLQLLQILQPEHKCLIELEKGEQSEKDEEEDFGEHKAVVPGGEEAGFFV